MPIHSPRWSWESEDRAMIHERETFHLETCFVFSMSRNPGIQGKLARRLARPDWMIDKVQRASIKGSWKLDNRSFAGGIWDKVARARRGEVADSVDTRWETLATSYYGVHHEAWDHIYTTLMLSMRYLNTFSRASSKIRLKKPRHCLIESVIKNRKIFKQKYSFLFRPRAWKPMHLK